MKRFFNILALTVLTLTGLTTANATEPAKSGSQMRHGTSFSHGVYYAGRDHNHWKSCYFDDRFGCHLYMCPTTSCYYYWCEADVRYYPVSYCPYGNYCPSRVCMWPSCPVSTPTHPPVCPPFNNTIHPIPSPTQPTQPTQPTGGGTVPPKGGILQGGISIYPSGPSIGNANPPAPTSPPAGTTVPPNAGINRGGATVLQSGVSLTGTNPTGPTAPATNPGRATPNRRR